MNELFPTQQYEVPLAWTDAETIQISIACNDEQGNFTGYMDGIQLGDCESASLSYLNWDDGDDLGLKLTIKTHFLIVGEHPPARFPIAGHKTWVGNCLWDAVWMRPKDVAELFNIAKSFGFSMDVGEVGLMTAWHGSQKITEALIQIALA